MYMFHIGSNAMVSVKKSSLELVEKILPNHVIYIVNF